MGISDWSSDVCSSDLFLTTSDAALCLWFKESLAGDEQSDFLIRFTDREGLHVAIDPSDLPMRTGRNNSRNRFVDRKRVVEGKSVYVRVDHGGRSIVIKKKQQQVHTHVCKNKNK